MIYLKIHSQLPIFCPEMTEINRLMGGALCRRTRAVMDFFGFAAVLPSLSFPSSVFPLVRVFVVRRNVPVRRL